MFPNETDAECDEEFLRFRHEHGRSRQIDAVRRHQRVALQQRAGRHVDNQEEEEKQLTETRSGETMESWRGGG